MVNRQFPFATNSYLMGINSTVRSKPEGKELNKLVLQYLLGIIVMIVKRALVNAYLALDTTLRISFD